MKIVNIKPNIVMEISEGNEIFDFAEIVLKEKLYVNGFSMRFTLKNMINSKEKCTSLEKNDIFEKVKGSFISLIKIDGKYIGVCCFIKYHPCTIQTFIKEEFRGKNIAFDVIKKMVGLIKSMDMKKSISFHHGEIQSLILFYKLWEAKVICLYNIVEENDKEKLRYIKAKLNGKTIDCFMLLEELNVLNEYINNRLKNTELLIGEAAWKKWLLKILMMVKL